MLSPVTEYIYDRLENDAEWSLFKELLEATALDSLVKQPESGKASQYTLFVVPNSVFGAANISNLSALADTLNAGQDREAWKATDNAMYRYAAYHFLSGAIFNNDFVKVDTSLYIFSSSYFGDAFGSRFPRIPEYRIEFLYQLRYGFHVGRTIPGNDQPPLQERYDTYGRCPDVYQGSEHDSCHDVGVDRL